MRKILLTLCLLASVIGAGAQNADIIEQKMLEYGRMLNNRQNIYYTVDSVGKVSDVLMSSTIDIDIQADIIEFFRSLPDFSGPGTFMASIVPAEAAQKPQGAVSQSVSGENEVNDSMSNRVLATREALKKQREMSKKPRQAGLPPAIDKAEKMPYVIGGKAVLTKYFKDNMVYPAKAKEYGSQDRILISFIVERDGTISNVTTVKSSDPYLEKEAERLIEGMPKWMPGFHEGKVRRVRFTMPVTFRL